MICFRFRLPACDWRNALTASDRSGQAETSTPRLVVVVPGSAAARTDDPLSSQETFEESRSRSSEGAFADIGRRIRSLEQKACGQNGRDRCDRADDC